LAGVLEIGVRLPTEFASAGEWLAEAQALEAAGAGWLWLESAAHGPAHWPLLGGLSVATRSCQLGLLPSAAEARGVAELARNALTLHTMTRGRFALGLPGSAPWKALATNLEEAEGEIVLFLRADRPPARHPATALALSARPPEKVASLVSGLPEPTSDGDPWTVWVEVDLPPNRPGWKQALTEYEAAGAGGLIVAHDPRLLDMLRNPDLEDDRADLQLAQG
jgi:hypothetical protein